ncbi:putative SmpA / OmlA family protein [Gammaproteobacteria bacterium]
MIFSCRPLVIIIFLASAPWFTGCATTRSYGSSTAVNEESLMRIHAGTSSSDDIREILGEPSEVESLDVGLELWTYRYIEYRGTYMPLLGPISTGNGLEGTVKFYLRDNKVERLERSRTQRKGGL